MKNKAVLHPELFSFLEGLKENNHKDWFESNRKRYTEIRESIIEFVTELISELTDVEPGLAEQDPRKAIFRINRDVRFGKDKSPYKTNMGAWLNPRGKSDNVGGYYLHLEPGNSMLAGGAYMPPAENLKAIRQEIDYNLSDFEAILKSPEYSRYFTGLSGERLKTTPKDYDKENPAIEYLKHKDFTAFYKIDDNSIILKPDFVSHSAKVFRAMQPLNRFLSQAVYGETGNL